MRDKMRRIPDCMKNYVKLDNMELNVKIDKLNNKWDIITSMVDNADFVEDFYDCKKMSEKEKISEAIRNFTRLEKLGIC